MFGPDYKAGCPSCSMIADGFDGFAVHLGQPRRRVVGGVARAACRSCRRTSAHGLDFPWASSHGGDFNFDFNISFTETRARDGHHRIQLRARRTRDGRDDAKSRGRRAFAATCGTDAPTYARDRPGMSAFAMRGRRRLPHVLHVRARARRPVGRVPVARSRAARTQRAGPWWKRHDEYAKG